MPAGCKARLSRDLISPSKLGIAGSIPQTVDQNSPVKDRIAQAISVGTVPILRVATKPLFCADPKLLAVRIVKMVADLAHHLHPSRTI